MADAFDEVFGGGAKPDPFDDIFGPAAAKRSDAWSKSPISNPVTDLARRELEDPAFAEDVGRQRKREEGRATRARDETNKRAQRLAGGGSSFATIDEEQLAADQDKYGNPEADSWGERVTKLGARAKDLFTMQIAGKLTEGIELGGTEFAMDPTKPFTSDEREQMVREHAQNIEALRKAGKLPGQKLYADAAADLKANDFKFGGATDYYLTSAAESLVQMLPTLATAIATRGRSEAEAAPKGLINIIKREFKDAAPGLIPLYEQTEGQQYEQSRSEGRTVGQAITDSQVNALAETIPEVMPLGMLMKPGGKFLPKLLGTAGLEGLSEGVTSAVELAYQKGTITPDMTWEEAWPQIRDSMIVGGIMGGGMTAVAQPFISEEEKRASDEIAAQPGTPQEMRPARTYTDEAGRRFNEEDLQWEKPTGRVKPDVPLTQSDIDSPMPDALIQEGKNLAREALENMPGVDAGALEVAGSPIAPTVSDAVGNLPEPRNSTFDLARYKAKNRTAESSGNDNARSATSSAAGRYQFTDGTWTGLGGDLSKKLDPDEQERMMDKLTLGNLARLEKAGVPITDGTMYMAHFLGAGGAIEALRNPNGKVDAKVRAANPFIGEDWTNARLASWATRKMGEKPGSYTTNPNSSADRYWAQQDGLEADLAPTESAADMVKRVTGDDVFGEGERVAVTVGNKTVEGTVEATYGEGEKAGVRIKQDDGTVFDEVLKDARDYGATIERVGRAPAAQEARSTTEAPIETQRVEAPAGAVESQGTRLAGEPTIQPDMLGGPDRSTAEMDAASYIPGVLQESVDNDEMQNRRERDAIVEAANYVLNPRNTAGDTQQSMRELSQAIGRNMQNPVEARAYAREILKQTGRAVAGDTGTTGNLEADAGSNVPGPPPSEPSTDWQTFGPNTGTLGIPRAQMPQVKNKDRAELLRWLKSERGISYKPENVSADELKPTQAEWSQSKADSWDRGNVKPEERRLIVSSDGHILDGHHQWVKAKQTGAKVPILRLSAKATEMLDAIRAFPKSTTSEDVPSAEATAERVKKESTAPEHATVGVDDRELDQIVREFGDYQADMFSDGEQITHVFQEPKKSEIVRLGNKTKVYHKDHGWMTPKEAATKIAEWKEHARSQGDTNANADRVVLSLFDLSGEWSKPWEEAGYQVYRFDIQDDPEVGDVNNFSTEFFGDWFGDFEGRDIYAILAACPCTDFASSGARHFAAKDKDGRTIASVKLVQQTLATIEYFKPAVWAVENPVGRIEKLGGLPPWRLSFDPNDLGDPYTKKTLLWGRFNADLPVAPVEPTEGSKMWSQYGGKSLATKNARSVTPEGFSYGFFMANNAVDHPVMAIANKFDRLDRGLIEKAVEAGVTEQQITEAVEDFYYQELDDEAANEAIKELMFEGRHRNAKVSQAREDAKNLGPAQPETLEEAQIAIEGGRKVKVGDRTTGTQETPKGWIVTTEYADMPGIVSQLGGGMERWSESYAQQRAMEDIALRLPNAATKAANDLRAEAQPHQDALASWAEGQPWEFQNPGTKGAARIVEKVRNEGYSSPRELKDIVRGGFVVDSPEEADAAVAAVSAQFVVSEDKGWKVVSGGYYDRKIILDFEGIKAEIQIIPRPIWEAKKAENNATYEKWRKIPGFDQPGAPAEATALETQMIESYAKAAAGTSFASAFKERMAAYASRNEVAKSAWDRLEPTFDASPGAGTQAEPSNTNANPRPSETPLATGRPSISKNERSSTTADVSTAEPVRKTPSYGAGNKLFTQDAAEKARALIRSKLNQLNSGFDPELAMAGMQLAGFHIEAGVRKFAALSKALADDLGTELSALKPYIAAWYNGARDLMEGHGEDVSDMDGAGAVRAATAMIPDASVTAPAGGIGDNEGTTDAAETVRVEEDNRRGDAAVDEARAPEERGVGQGADEPGAASSGQLPSGPVEDAGSDGRDASGRGEQRDNGAERSGAASPRSSRRVRATDRGTNFVAPKGALKREGGWLATANRNLDIVELVNRIEAENRPATPDEQALLAKFTGWGAGEIRNNLFRNVDRKSMTITPPAWGQGEWTDTVKRAAELIKGEDLRTALQSVQYAHYTSEGVVRSIWDALGRMGFGGGRILEPGMGIGNFFTAAPASMAEASSYTGIELESFTARIAKLLLPQENVLQGDFIKQAFPDGFFDAAIGNPPFANIKVTNDPAYKRQRFSLHDYFFAKSIDKVRPGGLMAFITSRYTMDKLDPKARQYIADRADLIGAIRLPQTAFKENAGTEVVTDVLFFQRRMPGAQVGGEQWVRTHEISVGGDKVAINEYFKRHPEMVLGKHATTGTMYRQNEYTVEPYAKGTIESHFAKAVAALPENVYTEQPKANIAAIEAKAFERDFRPASAKEGGLYVKDGKVLVVDRGSGVPVESIHDKVKPGDTAWLKDYVGLRDGLKEAQRAQLDDAPDWKAKHDALVKRYRAFTKKHGRIKEFTSYERKTTDDEGNPQTLTYRRYKWDRLLVDIEAPLVSSLEKITDEGTIVDGPFLLGRTLNKPTRPDIQTVEDALAVTLDEIGKLDLDYLAKLANRPRQEVIDHLGDLIFQAPDGSWQTTDEYLSGNVLQKLEEAEEAAKLDPKFERNVKALQEVQPAPLTYSNISVKLGAPWLRPETIAEFADEVLGFPGVPIKYDGASAHWTVEGANARYNRSATSEYGTQERSALELLDAVLNNRTIKVMNPKDSQGKTTVNPDATAAANEGAKKISDRFKTWLWEDSKRTAEYVETYNRAYNNIAPRRFNGDHLTLPGLSANFKPHPHVKRAVWRIIQTGNTYLAHAVGAGKTAEQIIGGQEQRRLGLIKKPMHVVPNHMLKQFEQEFLQLYPAANLMVADEQAFHTGNRQRFMAQAALNDPDAIIVTHSSFGKIEPSHEARQAVLDDMIAELESALEEAKDAGEARHTVSRIEKQIEQLTKRFEGKQQKGDKALTFDEMGVDFLIVDEAHEFRKLDFATNRVAKGIDSAGSAKALDLFIKSQWLEQRNPGRSMVLASGTPVTNTMAELYTVMRYLSLKELDRDGIRAFDAWASMFGEVVAAYEQNAAGGYEIVERFSKFVNVPELMKRVRNFMDVLTSEQLGDLVQRPKVRGGIPHNDLAPASEALDAYMKGTLNERLEESRKWKPSADQPGNPDPVINIITDARLASIDMRFVTAGRKSDPSSKLNRMIARIAEVHKATAGIEYRTKDGSKQPRKGAVQIVFSAVGFGDQVGKSRGFDARGWIDSELVRMGVKKSEIGWMSDANTHAKKEQLQKDVRSGKVRILIGSPKNMGTGLNVQDRLIGLHYLAPPWYPSDVEQPHGRIIRQGNLNPEVDLWWYATKGTYDSTQWGMVARKQKFIEQAMIGDDSVRVLEDISEASQFEMAAALAAGDERIIQVASYSSDIERLERLKGAHAATQRTLKGDIKTLETFELPRLEEKQRDLKAANEARGTGYQPFSATVGKATYDKHGEAGQAMLDAAQAVIDNSIAIKRTEIGRFLGKFPVFIEAYDKGSVSRLQFVMQIGPAEFYIGDPFSGAIDAMWDAVGFARRLETVVSRVPSELQDVTRRINEARDQLEKSKRKFGAPFPEEAELAEKIAERARLQEEIGADTTAAQAAQDTATAPPDAAASALVGEAGPALTEEQAQQFFAEADRLLNEIIPDKRIGLTARNKIRVGETQAQGAFDRSQRMIYLAYSMTQPKEWVLSHEALHAMKAMGVFTPTEWNLLVRDSWTNRSEAHRQKIRDRWDGLNLSEESLQEEAVAENFGEYVDMMEGPQMRELPPFVQRLFKRLADVVIAFARAYSFVTGNPKGRDAADAAKLFKRMRTGVVGSRPEGFGEAPRIAGQSFSPAPPVESDAFKRWFGKSFLKEDGKPIVYYHGTLHRTEPIEAFDRTKAAYDSASTINAIGTWFTDAPAVADIYAGASRPDQEPAFAGGALYPVYIKIESPLAVDAADLKRLWKAHAGGNDRLSGGDAGKFRDWMRSQGYDGLIMKADEMDAGFGTRQGSPNAEYVVPLDPEQIKSVYNAGTFDPSDPDIRASAGVAIEPGSPDFGGDTERRWQEAKKGIGDTGESMVAKARAWWGDLTQGFSRHWRDLPNEPRFADVGQQLRKLEAAPDAAMSSALDYLRGLVKGMSREEYDLFSRKVVLDDLAWDAGENRQLPFGFTPETLAEARANVDALVAANPKLTKALRDRKAHNRAIADEMVAAGVLTREQIKNPAYFRHMVLDYARNEAALARTGSKVKSPYWAKRMGSSMDINANLLEAELDWLQKARIDIATAKTIEWIKASEHNTRDALRTKARDSNRQKLEEILNADPAAKKEDGWFRSRIGMGIKEVADTLARGDLDPIPPHLQGAARSLAANTRDGEAPFALFAWILDNDKPGAMGAGMALKYMGLRKEWVRRQLGDSYIDPEDIAGLIKAFKPEGVVAWQPIEGRHLFTAKTISESALDMFVGKLSDTAYPGVDREELHRALSTVRRQLVVGGDRYTMALPEELAATLDEFGDRRGEGMVSRVFGGVLAAWKRWVLINPRRFLKYNINNMSGDLDALIAGAPQSLRKVGEAWRLLKAGKGARYTEALERGVFTSGLSVQEIPDINALSAMRHLSEAPSKRPDKLLMGAASKVWNALQDSTQFRENLFRLASYLHYVEQIEAGTPQLKIGYGASVPNMVDAVSDPKDKAALLARDLIGDYGAISVAGGWLRRYLVPFWSWTEINTRRYWRLTSNAFSQSKAKGIATGGLLGAGVAARSAVWMGVRMGMVYGLLYLWNHLLFGDEEDELGELQRAQLHLILGRDSDGQVITLRTQGALSDVLSTLGFTDAMAGFNKWRDGQGSIGAAIKDALKAPVNKVATGVNPIFSVPLEQAMGKEFWPDMFSPRQIHDRWRHLFSTFSLENEYDAAFDRPSRGYGRSWTESVIYRRDPGEMAYDEAKGIAYDWLSREKGQEAVSGGGSPRGEALRDYRMAVRYGDESAAVKALDRYEAAGGTDKSFRASVKRQHPLGPIAKKDRKAFLDSLTDEQLETFAEAEKWYLEDYVGKER